MLAMHQVRSKSSSRSLPRACIWDDEYKPDFRGSTWQSIAMMVQVSLNIIIAISAISPAGCLARIPEQITDIIAEYDARSKSTNQFCCDALRLRLFRTLLREK